MTNSDAFALHSRLTRMRQLFMLSVLGISPLLAGDVADMDGVWVLNVARSKWNAAPKPDAGRLVIEHQEPKLKCQRTLTTANADESNMKFDGLIDGKEHNGVIAARLSPYSILFTSKTDGGGTQEITVTMTKDGAHLVRRVQSSGPAGKLLWTELYDKQQP